MMRKSMVETGAGKTPLAVAQQLRYDETEVPSSSTDHWLLGGSSHCQASWSLHWLVHRSLITGYLDISLLTHSNSTGT